MKRLQKEAGFSLLVAVLANLILLALGFFAISLSTQDMRISMKVLGDKKAMSAAEAATHWLMVNFDPSDVGSVTRTNRPLTELAGGLEPRSRYSIKRPVPSATGPPQLTPVGYDMGSAQWVLLRYDTTVTGQNNDYGTRAAIDVGLCYGPVEAGSYR